MSAPRDPQRPLWNIGAPPGGWPPPWPQLVEIVQAIPHTQWTLVGGLMVQLHAAYARLALTRPTRDVDMLLHIETGAATFNGVRGELERIAYTPMSSVHWSSRARTTSKTRGTGIATSMTQLCWPARRRIRSVTAHA